MKSINLESEFVVAFGVGNAMFSSSMLVPVEAKYELRLVHSDMPIKIPFCLSC